MKNEQTAVIKNMEFLLKELHKEWERPGEVKSSVRIPYEKVEAIPLVVIKKDQTREPYDRTKIEKGVFRSCHKRPISVPQMNHLVDQVEAKVFSKEEREIPSSYIGELVMRYLEELDAVAYVRFASIYREFKDVDTFMEELKKILDK